MQPVRYFQKIGGKSGNPVRHIKHQGDIVVMQERQQSGKLRFIQCVRRRKAQGRDF
ncbi:hypothetical protein Gbfr_021_006 [Gluconobacter frateurii M-2]|nr:hypothetical protein Gbfr_021_006 [Gluconobacter frateurii M-2]